LSLALPKPRQARGPKINGQKKKKINTNKFPGFRETRNVNPRPFLGQKKSLNRKKKNGSMKKPNPSLLPPAGGPQKIHENGGILLQNERPLGVAEKTPAFFWGALPKFVGFFLSGVRPRSSSRPAPEKKTPPPLNLLRGGPPPHLLGSPVKKKNEISPPPKKWAPKNRAAPWPLFFRFKSPIVTKMPRRKNGTNKDPL